jgi:hypothetical protein
MGAFIALAVIVLMALLVVQLGTNALMLSGMSLPMARFQAASAFFGVGFTTKEAELVVNHPVRRRIILHLIIAGNIGLTSAMATLIVTFVQTNSEGGMPHGLLLFAVLLGILLMAVVWNLSFVKKPLDALMRISLEKGGMARAVVFFDPGPPATGVCDPSASYVERFRRALDADDVVRAAVTERNLGDFAAVREVDSGSQGLAREPGLEATAIDLETRNEHKMTGPALEPAGNVPIFVVAHEKAKSEFAQLAVE